MRFLLLISVAFMFFAAPAQAGCGLDGVNAWACDWGGKAASKTVRHRKVAKRTVRTKRTARARTVRASGHRLVRISARYKGRNPTGRRYLWCMDFVNLTLRKAGKRTTRSRWARSALRIGRRTHAKPGAIGVMPRGRRGGHVGIVVAVRGSRVLLRGGNQCGRRGARRVCDRWYSKRRFIGFRDI